MIASLSIFGSSNSVKGSVVSMTIHPHTHSKKYTNQYHSSRRRSWTAYHDRPSRCPSRPRASSGYCALPPLFRTFVRVLDQILPIEGRLGGGNKYGERGSCGRDGRKEGSRGGWVHIRDPASYFPMSSALSCPAPWKGEKEDKGVAHAHAEGRGVHEKTDVRCQHQLAPGR